MLKKGDLYKHFKGATLEEKNIYEIIETGVKYSGDASEKSIENLVVYKNIFQGKIFAREYEDLVAELPEDKQKQYGQLHRIEKLTPEEINMVKMRLNTIK
ncbi:MAG: DUF1653 domain-containing protein [Clostridia bacterium]|nr:DUF1653 domain-containing protein [Clostridia bacterium]